MSTPALLPTLTETPKRRGRHRCTERESAILAAAIELLEKKPLHEVTAEAIAARAGVSKATLYKWWPNKSLVALDAFLLHMQSEVPSPDTGSARTDFIEQVKLLIRFLASPYGRIYGQFIAEGRNDAAFLEQFRERFIQPRRDGIRVIWQRGVDRGEIRPDICSDIALDLIYGPVMFRMLTGHSPLNDEQAEAIVDAAFSGIRN